MRGRLPAADDALSSGVAAAARSGRLSRGRLRPHHDADDLRHDPPLRRRAARLPALAAQGEAQRPRAGHLHPHPLEPLAELPALDLDLCLLGAHGHPPAFPQRRSVHRSRLHRRCARPRRRSHARRQAGVEKARTAEKTQAHLSAHGSLLRPVIRHADDRRHDLRHIKRLV